MTKRFSQCTYAQEFAANNDRESERIHFLNEPFFARYVRLHPTDWHNHVSMRAAILGCPHQGKRSMRREIPLIDLGLFQAPALPDTSA